MTLYYSDIQKKEEVEKVILFEDFFDKVDLESICERDLKVFLREAFEKESNCYVKKIILEIICALTFGSKLNRHFTIDFLLDIDENVSYPILQSVIKNLSFLYQDEPEIIKKIESFKENENADVASEAYFRLGIISIFNDAFIDKSTEEFLTHIYQTKELFIKSSNLLENRVDAEFYVNIIDFFSLCFQENYSRIRDLFETLSIQNWTRMLFSFNDKSFELEYRIFNIIKSIFGIYNIVRESEKWIRIDEELAKLCQYQCAIINSEIINSTTYRKYLSNIKQTIDNSLLKPYYSKNLNSLAVRIKTLRNSIMDVTCPELKEFLDYILNNIKAQNVKKNEQIDEITFIVKLKEMFPDKDILNIVKDLKSVENIQTIVDVIGEYIKQKYKRDAEVITGTNVGEEIFNRIKEQIDYLLPNYQVYSRNVFLNIIEHVISYVVSTMHSNKTDYLFLYNKKAGGTGDEATERDLQDSMYEYFKKTRLNSLALHYEKKDFADGGRVDIVYSDGKITIPIELKKTDEKITDEGIRKKYLSQIQTYIYPHNQLGIFILLDLNEKSQPTNDVRDLFELEHLEPLYDIKDKYPDYVVRVIIPGNRYLPSQKSIYK